MTQFYINYCCACLKWNNCLALIILLETPSKTLFDDFTLAVWCFKFNIKTGISQYLIRNNQLV